MEVQATDRLTTSAARPTGRARPKPESHEDEASRPAEPTSVEAAPEKEADRTRERLERLLEQASQRADRRVGISLDEQTGEPIVRITERESGKLIRQIPPEELQRISHKLSEIRGILIDRDA